MKTIIIASLVAACALIAIRARGDGPWITEDARVGIGHNTIITRVHDTAANVTCWLAKNDRGLNTSPSISCLPDSQVKR